MHPCLNVDEILRLLARELVASEAKAAAVSLACCCKSFEDPVLDTLWETQSKLLPLLKSLPADVWKVEARRFVSPPSAFISPRLIALPRKSFVRLPTKEEWARFRKYARGIRKLKMDASKDPLVPDVLLVLQLRNGDESLLPGLGFFKCEAVSEAFAPFIPLFLSPRTVEIHIKFVASTPTVMIASTIARFSTLCPNIQSLLLDPLRKNRVITEAASEMLLACNRDTLQVFHVGCSLTEEAHRFLHTLPRLRDLWIFTQGQTSLPPLALPDLRHIYVVWDSGRDWLQGFCGATIQKLETITIRPVPGSTIGGFLEEFQTVALATSLQNTLSSFRFSTSQSWNPNYPSLLVFKQMKKLEIQFSCHDGCSSTVDDDIVTSLAQAMPKLETLRLGKAPCSALTGVTLKGLVALACHCPQLSELCIHIQAGKLGEAATTGIEPPHPSGNAVVIPRVDCALTVLQVGEAPIPQEVVPAVAQTLLKVFPRILEVKHVDPGWKSVLETIKLSRRTGGHIDHTGKAHFLHLECLLVTSCQAMHLYRKSGGK